jgi:hypothetical protein
MPRRRISFLKKVLRQCAFTVPITGLISALILYFSRETIFPAIFISTIVAWIASDTLIYLFISGGNGAVHVPIFGNKTTFKAYGFVVFFISIMMISIALNFFTDVITSVLSNYLALWYVDIITGLSLAGLVFLDLNEKYYNHDT